MRSVSVFLFNLFFFNVYWLLYILKLALLPHTDTQSPDVIVDLPVGYTISWMSLYTAVAVYNHVKKITLDECASVLGQKKSAAHRRVGALQLYFDFVTFRQIHTGFMICT